MDRLFGGSSKLESTHVAHVATGLVLTYSLIDLILTSRQYNDDKRKSTAIMIAVNVVMTLWIITLLILSKHTKMSAQMNLGLVGFSIVSYCLVRLLNAFDFLG